MAGGFEPSTVDLSFRQWEPVGLNGFAVEDTKMSNGIRDQFVRDMQVAGLSAGTQAQYLSSVDLFFKTTWLSTEAVTKQEAQMFLIGCGIGMWRARRSGDIGSR